MSVYLFVYLSIYIYIFLFLLRIEFQLRNKLQLTRCFQSACTYLSTRLNVRKVMSAEIDICWLICGWENCQFEWKFFCSSLLLFALMNSLIIFIYFLFEPEKCAYGIAWAPTQHYRLLTRLERICCCVVVTAN